jgi:hypothetical protein
MFSSKIVRLYHSVRGITESMQLLTASQLPESIKTANCPLLSRTVNFCKAKEVKSFGLLLAEYDGTSATHPIKSKVAKKASIMRACPFLFENSLKAVGLQN